MYRLSRLLWAITLVSLPITSFRYMPFMGAGTLVRPLALYPLAALFLVLFIMLLRREIGFPRLRSLTVLAAFILVAMASTAIGATFAPVELRGVEYWDRAVRAFVTLAIGLSFFLAAAWMNQDETQVRFSVRWLMVGMVGHIVWGAVQLYGLNHGYRAELREIQELFSIRGLVRNRRVSGFAFEPSWLAGQLAVLYLPWLVAQILTSDYFQWLKTSLADRLRLLVAPILLLGALATLLATYSRTGLVTVAFAMAVTVLAAGRGVARSAWNWFWLGFRRRVEKGSWAHIQAIVLRLLLIILTVASLSGAGIFLANRNYISSLWASDLSDVWKYLSNASMGPRVGYVVGAMSAFDANPLTGVGLGASGFWIYQNIPNELLMGEPEIAETLAPTSTLFPNPKNLYARLLAETGLVGLVLFMAFWLFFWAEGLAAARRSSQSMRFLGAAAIFTLTALGFYTISVDSFAMPELWLNLGILAGVFARQEQ